MNPILVVLFLIISPFLFPATSQAQICFETVFSFTIPHLSFVTLKVFDDWAERSQHRQMRR
jgi:hypothetical protein